MRKGSGEIKKLSSLFDKYRKTLHAPQGSVISCFQEIVAELFSINIKAERVSYSVGSRILSVRASGPLKSEITLHKKEILAHMKGRLGDQNAPRDIL
jgi:hypothetical protein